MGDPEMKKRTADIGLIPFDTPSVAGIDDYIKSERVKWGTLVEKIVDAVKDIAREVRAEEGELQQLTPSIYALYTPNIDHALD